MNMKVAIALVFSILICSVNVFAEENGNIDGELNAYMKKYVDVCNHYIDALKFMRKDYTVLQDLFNKQDALSSKQLKLLKQDKYDAAKYVKLTKELEQISEKINLYNDGLEAIGLSYINDLDALNKIDDKKIRSQLKSKIDKTIDTFNTFKMCFDGSNNEMPVCKFEYNKICTRFGLDNVGLYTDSTIDLVNINRSYIDIDKVNKNFDKFITLVCYINGSMTSEYEPKDLVINYEFPHHEYLDGGLTIYDNETFKDLCIDNGWINEHNTKVAALKAKYQLLNESTYTYDTQAIKDKCNKKVAFNCSDAYVIRNSVIFSYQTVGCEIRDVTKEDVENDIKLYESNADKLNHSVLLDRIEFCQDAIANNYSWLYKKPVLEKTCLNNKKKAKSRK